MNSCNQEWCKNHVQSKISPACSLRHYDVMQTKLDMWVTHYFWFYGHYIFAELLISHLTNWFIQIKSILQRECQIRATNLRHERHWYNTSATRATQVKNFYLWMKGDVFLYFKKLKVMWMNKEYRNSDTSVFQWVFRNL